MRLPYGGALPAVPLALAHGVLMPLPDAHGAIELWSKELERALAVAPQRRSRAERLAAAARYDIASTGPIWLRLVEEMAQGKIHR